jgi:hypothetical protein
VGLFWKTDIAVNTRSLLSDIFTMFNLCIPEAYVGRRSTKQKQKMFEPSGNSDNESIFDVVSNFSA